MHSFDSAPGDRFKHAVRCLLLAGTVAAGLAHGEAQVSIASPDGGLTGSVFVDAQGQLSYALVSRDGGRAILLPSRIGVTVDGIALGAHAVLGKPERSAVDERFPILGVKTMARNHASVVAIAVSDGGRSFMVEARMFDDGFAWRIVVAEKGRHHVGGEASSWALPEHTRVWYSDRPNNWKLKSYAGEWFSTEIERLPSISTQGPVQTAPLVFERAGGGYGLITEAALADYSGMRLRAVSHGQVQADFTEGEAGFDVEGPVTTPWRVTLVEKDLNGLVNSDVLQSLNPPPDAKLFADMRYIKPGRAVWRFWSRQTGSPLQEREFVDYAARLGFEYTLVDDGWDDWPDRWQSMTELCAYAATKEVGVFAWRNYLYISSPNDDWAQLREFLDHAKKAGLRGVKIDFINAESKRHIDFERAALRLAAERQLMVDFHGVQKPTGEVRSYPNAISREGIRGLELNRMAEGPVPPSHNAALPFTRFAVGYGDYTPLGYTWPGETTWAHQLSTVVAFTSPFMTIAEDPEVLLTDAATRPGLDLLKAIPATWDETVVLPPSDIGTLSVIARRTGGAWFLSVLNGKNTPVDLKPIYLSFLGQGHFEAVIVSSPERRSLARQVVKDFTKKTALPVHLTGGDGLVVWFRPAAR